MASRPYDIVVFGSTGYTGKFVNEELYRLQNGGRQDLKWAAAGRSREKLQKSLSESGIEGVDLVVADVSDQDSLEHMCSQTTVLINCVGPYQLYGEPVVKACISQKTNYVDITGETYFMETVAVRYDEQARDAGVYVVSACGFDCIPNDLGALLLQKSFNGDLAYMESYMSVSSGSRFNTGTWESFLRSIQNHSKLTALRKQQDLPKLSLPRTKAPKRRLVFYSSLARRWCLPFPAPDRAMVYRTMRYRQDSEGVSPFNFSLYFCMDSFWKSVLMICSFMILVPMVMTNWGLKLLLKAGKFSYRCSSSYNNRHYCLHQFPGFFSGGAAVRAGPTRKELESTTFSVYLQGVGYSSDADRSKKPDSKVTVKVSSTVDPGYVGTSLMLVHSALCFLDDKDKLPPCGGVYTPAVAFGNTRLMQNLDDTGKIKFEVIPGTEA